SGRSRSASALLVPARWALHAPARASTIWPQQPLSYSSSTGAVISARLYLGPRAGARFGRTSHLSAGRGFGPAGPRGANGPSRAGPGAYLSAGRRGAGDAR